MKRTMVLIVMLMLSATVVFGQAGTVGVFQDSGAASCNLLDPAVGLTTWFLLHTNNVGASAMQCKATLPAAFTGSYLSDTPQIGVQIGNTQTGLAVGYGTCVITSVVVVAFINVFGQGTTPACTLYPVTDDPAAGTGTIDVVDCVNQFSVAQPHPLNVINPDASCMCSVVPVKESTWGAIKSLYSTTE